MLKHFDFECPNEHKFDAFVEGADGKPDECPACKSSGPFKKLPSVGFSPQTIVVDYPGAKRLKAGYAHTHNRPAEKKGTQVSMYGRK